MRTSSPSSIHEPRVPCQSALPKTLGVLALWAIGVLGCNADPLSAPDDGGRGDAIVALDLVTPGDGGAPADLSSPVDLLLPCAPATRIGDTIRVACMTWVDFRAVGGFRPPLPPGSTCNGDISYSLELPAGVMSWTQCAVPVDIKKPWLLDQGRRALAAPELDSVLTALGRVVIVQGTTCGADKPLMTVVVTTPAGDRRYTDEFWGCNGPTGTYVRDIDGLFGAMSPLAHL